jgi:hypothetical protein
VVDYLFSTGRVVALLVGLHFVSLSRSPQADGPQRKLWREAREPTKPYLRFASSAPPSKTPLESGPPWQHHAPPMGPQLAAVGPSITAPRFRTTLPCRTRPRGLTSWRRAALPKDEVSWCPQPYRRRWYGLYNVSLPHLCMWFSLIVYSVLCRIITWSMRRSPLGMASRSVEVSLTGSIRIDCYCYIFLVFCVDCCREVRGWTK